LWSILGRTQRRERQTPKVGNAKSQNRDLEFLKIRDRRKSKSVARRSRTDCASTSRDLSRHNRQQSCKARASRFPMHSHKDAQRGLLHLNSAPNEATTSIWLKAMMVRSDLTGNNEPSKNESGTEVERWD
jgi:hypothetical protein